MIAAALRIAAVWIVLQVAVVATMWAARRAIPDDTQAIQDADDQACALTRPDDDTAFLASVEADLIRSRAVRRLARRLETTR